MLLSCAGVVRAASIVPPENLGELAQTSHAVVLAQAGASTVAQRGPLLFTQTTFEVLTVVAGGVARGDHLTVEAPGGELDGITWAVPGSPRFEPGEVYLLFLEQKPTGEWLTKMLAYGLLHRIPGRDGSSLLSPLSEDAGIQPFPRRDGILPERIETYREAALLPHLRAIAGGTAAWDSRKVLARSDQVPLQAVALAPPAGCTYITGGTPYARWPYNVSPPLGQVTMYGSAGGDPSISGGGFTQLQGALGMWMGIANTSLNLAYGGAMSYTMTCTSGQDTPAYGVNIVMFNDPCGDITDLSGCSGVLGFGGPWYGSSNHTFDGTTWYSITSWFVVLNNGVGCLGSTYYQRMLAHELGHGLGFGHFNSDPNALMYYMCCNTIDSTDTTCAQYTYPGSGGSPAPTVTAVNPSAGPPAGGTSITITGTGFQTGATVTLGGTAATGVTVSNSTTITATTPAHGAGTVNVVVTNPDAQSGTKVNGFTYANPPSVTSVYPNFGPTAGGTGITISGSNFVTGATVTLGGTSATGVTVSNSTTITATTAAHATGAVNVVVQNPDTQTGTLTNGYFYGPSVTGTLFYPLTPCRVLDTRNATGPLGGPVLSAGGTRSFTVTSTCGIPTNAKTISVNLTITGPTANGELRVFPGNGTLPSTSAISFKAGQTRANNAHVLLATDGTGSFKVVNNSTGTVHLILDVNGYYR